MPVRGVIAALALAAALLAPRHAGVEAQPAKDLDVEFRTTVRPFLDTHCGGCHGADRPKADLNLQRFTTPASIAADFAQWEEVLSQLKGGEMPPRTAKAQPTAAQRQAVVAWLDAFRAREAERNAGDPGVVLPRRLSVAEYDATIRDLTGVDIRPARDFPVDPANAAGFDNTGESLTMSPALLAKYLQAAKFVSEHLILNPDGFTFAPYPVIAETDRDKHSIRRIVDFYLAQPTDLAPYFFAAWRHKNDPGSTVAAVAAAAKVSPKYLEVVLTQLNEPAPERGPIAAVRVLFQSLPKDEAGARRGCEDLRDVVLKVRSRTQVKVRNLSVSGMNAGAQALVLWKDREMATSRRTYGGGALTLKTDDLPAAARAKLTPPDDDAGKQAYEEGFKHFCDVFPDAFYVKERARVFLGPNGEQGNTGRLLSAGFHNQMGYFRDDQPLCELILDAKGKRDLDRLWDEFDFACDIPARMHSGLIWFERSESPYLAGKQFDFARAEDKDVISPDKFGRFRDEYVKHTLKQSRDDTATQAVKDHFKISEANIRRVEAARAAAEPKHVAALQAFAEKAYRRKLTPAEKDGVAAFYRRLRGEEATHEEAVRDTVVRVLVSPHFCFRVDLPAAGAAGRTAPLADDALASRLSYFLWSSMPDAELLDHAAKGMLRQPAVLTAQVRRMLADDRARGLATNFGGSWLDFRRFEEHNAVDRGRFPQFDNDLRAAMAEEPVRFLLDVMQTDRPVTDVLGGKHTFVNAALAKHYGMPPPAGKGWARVDDADRYGRGGVLPMGVFLTKNAPGLRTSPVKRGYWVVTKLLGERIPPPPPDVPELPADEGKLGTRTVREALAKHREHPSCAGCHARFDSFGLAFEGFGPVGEKRAKDLAGNPVDTRVSFPGNIDGEGVGGLRGYLQARRQEAFVDTLCRKLLSYGLGRTLLLTDEPTVAAMKARLARDGGRFAGLAEVVVTSPQFLNRRASAP